MSLLTTLGLNGSVVWQFLIFAVVFVFLSQLLFKPYLNSYLERQKRTSGTQDLAKQFHEETELLQEEFAKEAKVINAKIKEIHANAQKQGNQSYEETIKKGQHAVQEISSEGTKKIEALSGSVQSGFGLEVERLSSGIVEKMIGKGV